VSTARAPRRRCGAPGCTNFARGRTAFCAAHKGEAVRRPEAPAGEAFAERMAREDAERRAEAARVFRERLDDGDYRGLFGERLTGLMTQAAAEGGVDDEIAVLRIVMARLVAEEDDPVTLAKAISRVAAVSIQAAKARRAISGQLAEGLTDAITAILADLDGG
jgi:hypothetical protein